MSDPVDWPVPSPRTLPSPHVERAMQSQSSLTVALALLRALPAADLLGVEPADATRWVTDRAGEAGA